MISNCERCALPDIVRRIKLYKNAALAANANIAASDSPTEAQPYQTAATEAADNLRVADGERAEFLRTWAGFCAECKFGA